MSSVFLIDDLKLDVKMNPGGLEARVLSSQFRFPGYLPDGSFVSVQRNGDIVKIFNLPMYACKSVISSDFCPLTAKLVLEQTAADTLEGTIEVAGIIEKVISYQSLTHESATLRCSGNVLLIKVTQSQSYVH